MSINILVVPKGNCTINQMKDMFEKKNKKFQTEWGGEYCNLKPFLHQIGVYSRHSCIHIDQQNGQVPTKHRHMPLYILACGMPSAQQFTW